MIEFMDLIEATRKLVTAGIGTGSEEVEDETWRRLVGVDSDTLAKFCALYVHKQIADGLIEATDEEAIELATMMIEGVAIGLLVEEGSDE